MIRGDTGTERALAARRLLVAIVFSAAVAFRFGVPAAAAADEPINVGPAEMVQRRIVPPAMPSPFPRIERDDRAWDLCGEHSGCYDPMSNTVHVVADASRFVVLHELGHAADWTLYTDDERAEIQDRLGFAEEVPWDGITADGFEYLVAPAELAADAYAACRMKLSPRRGVWHRSYGYTPQTHNEHAWICRAIARAAAG